ncbi:hypothetical protein [Palleronia sp.]|uniref:hypothetical protein n=1 Tax=Palleronia sp. TaxID=1940284 RepID=UPI0035C799D4
MPEIITDPETIHVFAVDLSMQETVELAGDGAALSRALGGVSADPERAVALDSRSLGDLGLPNYLVEGEGITKESIEPDAGRLMAVKGPVLILRPRAVGQSFRPQEPLRHLGSYRLERGTPASVPLRAASAEGSASGVPPAAPPPASRDRRASGMVAMAALAVALLVAFVVWWVAS